MFVVLILYIYIYIYIYHTHILFPSLSPLSRSLFIELTMLLFYIFPPNTLYDRILQMQLISLARKTARASMTTNPMAWDSLASLEEPTASTTSRVARSTWTTLLPTPCVSRSRALLLPAAIRLQAEKVQNGREVHELQRRIQIFICTCIPISYCDHCRFRFRPLTGGWMPPGSPLISICSNITTGYFARTSKHVESELLTRICSGYK